jgi:hypothetical protein
VILPPLVFPAHSVSPYLSRSQRERETDKERQIKRERDKEREIKRDR